ARHDRAAARPSAFGPALGTVDRDRSLAASRPPGSGPDHVLPKTWPLRLQSRIQGCPGARQESGSFDVALLISLSVVASSIRRGRVASCDDADRTTPAV